MKSNNKLNTALKDALYEHHEPLREAQWERLRAELEEKKKRRFLPWFFLFAGVLLGAGTIYLYVDSQRCTIAGLEQTATTQTNSHASDQNSAAKKSNELPSVDVNSTMSNAGAPAVNRGTSASQRPRITNQSPSNLYAATVQQSIDDGHGPTLKAISWSGNTSSGSDVKETGSGAKDNTIGQSLPDKTMDEVKKDEQLLTINKDKELINAMPAPTAIPNKDSSDKKETSKNDDSVIVKQARWIFGLYVGYSGVRSTITGVSNEENLHKDSRNLFQMSNDNQSAMLYNLNIERKFSQRFGLRFNTGLHFKQINNKVNFSYKLSQVPIRLADNKILGYINVPDSSNPLIINFRENQSYSFLAIPFVLNYSIPINSKSELLMGGGVSVSALVASTGSAFSLNELSYKQAGDMIKNPFNLGFSATLGYSRQLFGNWWLSAEAGWQSNNLKYDLGYGDLTSRMISRSLGLNLRYKLLN